NYAQPTLMTDQSSDMRTEIDTNPVEQPNHESAVKIGVIGGSLLSGALGFLVLATSPPPIREEDPNPVETVES
ncbi:MAG: hypothetical protein MK085_09520, partial [Phycisphaerales bacterium]|nr:hypothetical protein [Phycisphaerales bacterium]